MRYFQIRQKILIVGLFSLVLFTSATASVGRQSISVKPEKEVSDEALIRRVADYVIANTSNNLLDLRGDVSYYISENLVSSDSMIVESHFNGWYYQNMMILNGMNRIGKVLGDSRYASYTDNNLDFIYRNLDFFDRQQAAGLMPKPRGESQFSRISYYYNLTSPWMTGLANFWIAKGRETGDQRYDAYTERFKNYALTIARTTDGQLLNDGNVRTDDASLMIPGMLELAKTEDTQKWNDEAVSQALGAHRYLFDKTDKLYYHGWNPEKNIGYTIYWGRASGWMALAWVAVLSGLPEDHPKYQAALTAYREFMDGLRRWQTEEGGWRQVINHPEAWIETSCTGMFTYAMARGVNEGWLDSSYKEDAIKGWNALRKKVLSDGRMVDTCPSTHHDQDVNFYLNRERRENDPHAYGPFLLAGSEILKLKKGK